MEFSFFRTFQTFYRLLYISHSLLLELSAVLCLSLVTHGHASVALEH
jgi:hypothetical protein